MAERGRVGLGIVLWLLSAAAAPAQELTQAQQYFQQGLAYQTGSDGRSVDLDKALRAYLQAIRLDPQLYEAHVNAGKAYFQRHDYRRAKSHFSDAIRLVRARQDLSDAIEARLASDLGSCYHMEGDLAEAERWFRGAIGLDPTLAEAHLNLINLLLLQDRREAARQQIQVASAQAPDERYGRFEGRLRTTETYSDWFSAPWFMDSILYVLGGIALGLGLLFLLRGRGRPGGRRRRKG